jgi:hypothetical protein
MGTSIACRQKLGKWWRKQRTLALGVELCAAQCSGALPEVHDGYDRLATVMRSTRLRAGFESDLLRI